MSIHELKTWPETFNATLSGSKTFEYRKDDRGYEIGDLLKLLEFVPERSQYQVEHGYTGRMITKRVTYVLRGGHFGVPEGYAVMGLRDA